MVYCTHITEFDRIYLGKGFEKVVAAVRVEGLWGRQEDGETISGLVCLGNRKFGIQETGSWAFRRAAQ